MPVQRTTYAPSLDTGTDDPLAENPVAKLSLRQLQTVEDGIGGLSNLTDEQKKRIQEFIDAQKPQAAAGDQAGADTGAAQNLDPQSFAELILQWINAHAGRTQPSSNPLQSFGGNMQNLGGGSNNRVAGTLGSGFNGPFNKIWPSHSGPDAATWEPPGKQGQIGGGVPQLDLNGTKYTSLEGKAADANISLRGFDPVEQPGIALSDAQAKSLGVKVGEHVNVYDSVTGKTINATYYDNAGGRGPGHVEMSPRLAADFGLIKFPIVKDEINGAEQMRNRFFITRA